MTTEPIISCPNCKTKIKLNESLAAPLVEAIKKDYESRLEKRDADIAIRESALLREKEGVVKAKASIEAEVAEKVRESQAAISQEEAKKARLLFEADLSNKDRMILDLNSATSELNAKLATAQTAEVEFRKKERELAEQMREAELVIQKRVAEGITAVEEKARQRADEESRLKMMEKDKVIADAQRQIDEMKRKMEQGSQQLQGEVLELELESILRSKFPLDSIEPVPKGEFGGDAIQKVVNNVGQACGKILWESKRTKNWSDGWLAKLRDDQRAAKADIAIIISEALPKGVQSFDQIDGVWVATPSLAVALATALRVSMIELANARQAADGQQTKTELVYQYLTGPRFRHRVQAIVEKFSDMQDDLEKERKTMTRLWAKREEQIRSVIDATAGMYGDLQGIAGKTLQEIEELNVLSLPEPAAAN
jgi:hypothetical protein